MLLVRCLAVAVGLGPFPDLGAMSRCELLPLGQVQVGGLRAQHDAMMLEARGRAWEAWFPGV